MVQEPVYMETDSHMVEVLMDAYKAETGDEKAEPIVMRGGTYAKMINNILAFGALFPWEDDTMHQANEKISVDSMMKMARIYARALENLCFDRGE
jgi:succinyl-diaminopimelate desuccinylase